MSSEPGSADVLGPPYRSETFQLRPDDEGEVVATLVHRPSEFNNGRAVLHVHGFADYFFQTAAADFWVARGYDFYALDLRKYGRSLRPHQTPNYVADLKDYYEEIDLAFARVRTNHDHVVISAHSTGGLTMPLWAHDRQAPIAGMVLNAPWLVMHGDAFTRNLAMPVIQRLGAAQPKRLIPRTVSGLFARSIHRDHEGEWPFDLSWKPLHSWPVYAGWLRAIRKGQARVADGLNISAPILMVSSAASTEPDSINDPAVFSTDIVLDVEKMRARAPFLGHHVTIVQIPGAMHDVTLSREPIRMKVFDEFARFLSAYVDR
ncbi:MAG: alpha/beta hydrolase [Marmoricola sp.]|nr:alpha/beta hydrolase [Marmoricola sp.]